MIADAIVAMEGNGPLNGTPQRLKRIGLADDPVAADAMRARPLKPRFGENHHIRVGAQPLGNASDHWTDHFGEATASPRIPSEVVPQFEHPARTSSRGTCPEERAWLTKKTPPAPVTERWPDDLISGSEETGTLAPLLVRQNPSTQIAAPWRL